MLSGSVRCQSGPQNGQGRIVGWHKLTISHDVAMCLHICIWVAVPRERHLMLQICVVIRTVVVATFQKNYREHGADEENHAKCANENEKPGFIDAQVGVSWQLDIFNMVGA